jgi:hypothetical protein
MVDLTRQNDPVFAACLMDEEMHIIESAVNTSRMYGPACHAE